MKPGFLASIGPVYIGKLAEAKPASTRRVNVTIHLHRWTRGHDLKNLTDLLIEFEVRYGTPILWS